MRVSYTGQWRWTNPIAQLSLNTHLTMFSISERTLAAIIRSLDQSKSKPATESGGINAFQPLPRPNEEVLMLSGTIVTIARKHYLRLFALF